MLAIGVGLLFGLWITGCVSRADKDRCARFCEGLALANVYPLFLSMEEKAEVLHFPLSSKPEVCLCSLGFQSGAIGGRP